jgi:hypothetical protein
VRYSRKIEVVQRFLDNYGLKGEVYTGRTERMSFFKPTEIITIMKEAKVLFNLALGKDSFKIEQIDNSFETSNLVDDLVKRLKVAGLRYVR